MRGLATTQGANYQGDMQNGGAHPQATEIVKFEGETVIIDVMHVASNGLFEGWQWFSEKLSSQCTLGLDIEWRSGDQLGSNSDGAIDLVQIADNDAAFLFRTHQDECRLPQLLRQVLESSVVHKVCIGNAKDKCAALENAFGLQGKIQEVVDVIEIAANKGIAAADLQQLAEQLRWRLRRNMHASSGKWGSLTLAPVQVRHAADGAYLALRAWQDLSRMKSAQGDADAANTSSDMCAGELSDGMDPDDQVQQPSKWTAATVSHGGALLAREADVENLPDYVDVNVAYEGELFCMLCKMRCSNLSMMQQHLSSDKHAKACHQHGYPLIWFVEERSRMEDRETGKPVSRAEYADLVLKPLPAFDRKPKRPGKGKGKFNHVDLSEDGWYSDAWPRGPDPNPADPQTAAAWRNWSGSAWRRRREPYNGMGYMPSQASNAPFGRYRHRKLGGRRVYEGQTVFALRDLWEAPGGWNPSTYLIPIAAGQSIFVLHIEDDSLWGVSDNRMGWLPLDEVTTNPGFHAGPPGDSWGPSYNRNLNMYIAHPHGYGVHVSDAWPEDSRTDDYDNPFPDENYPDDEDRDGQWAVVNRQVSDCPPEYDGTTFLAAEIGDDVFVEHVEEGWLWGTIGEESGWLPIDAVDSADFDEEEEEEEEVEKEVEEVEEEDEQDQEVDYEIHNNFNDEVDEDDPNFSGIF